MQGGGDGGDRNHLKKVLSELVDLQMEDWVVIV